jgi:epoxyqueuosine reductase
LAERFDGWWFGCDRCQEVCPWNRFAPGAGDGRLRGDGRAEAQLLAIDPDDFDKIFAGRAIRRLGYARFRRNLLVALFSRNLPIPPTLRHDPLVAEQVRELGLG